MAYPNEVLVLIRGGGDLASGVAWRLHRAGFRVVIAETAQPTTIRRTVAFAQSVYDGEVEVEGVLARCTPFSEIFSTLAKGMIAVVIDPDMDNVLSLSPQILVDARMQKGRDVRRPTHLEDAPFVIALGPGFTAGIDADAVVETGRGHTLGRLILDGEALPDSGVPGMVEGEAQRRVVRAPAEGIFLPVWPDLGKEEKGQEGKKGEKGGKKIGSLVQAGECLAHVRLLSSQGAEIEIKAEISGVLRGLLQPGLHVFAGMKVGDIDPRGVVTHCYTISDKSLAVAGGVMEGCLRFLYGDLKDFSVTHSKAGKREKMGKMGKMGKKISPADQPGFGPGGQAGKP